MWSNRIIITSPYEIKTRQDRLLDKMRNLLRYVRGSRAFGRDSEYFRYDREQRDTFDMHPLAKNNNNSYPSKK